MTHGQSDLEKLQWKRTSFIPIDSAGSGYANRDG